jgi:hypothetical protein
VGSVSFKSSSPLRYALRQSGGARAYGVAGVVGVGVVPFGVGARWAKGRDVLSVKLGVAILTMGTRPKELTALLASVEAQTVKAARTVVVGNGCALPELPAWVEAVELPDNRGVTGGRNVALEHLRDVDVVVDLDDDGLLVDDGVFAKLTELYSSDPQVGIVSFRIADETGLTQRRHVPGYGPAIRCAAVMSPPSSEAAMPCR